MTDRHSSVPAAQIPELPLTAVQPVVPTPVPSNVQGAAASASTLEASNWMKRLETLRVTNALLAVLVVLGAGSLFHRTTFEYMTVSPSDGTFDQQMSAYGAKGWKTETCRRATSSLDLTSYECIMSRAKASF